MRSRRYEEFLASFDAHRVRYLIVGAYAVAHHARPRATKDLDILVDPGARNAERVLDAVRDFFGSDLGLTAEDLTAPGRFVQLRIAPSRIDLLSKLASSGFDALWKRRVKGRFADVPVHFISLDDLIRKKEATGRDQDRADLRALRMAKKRRR